MYVVEKEQCCGCLACKEICPVDAINIVVDKEGFEYPEIDNNKCIQCGKCRRMCAINRKNIDENKKPISIIGVKAKNEEDRITSRSGGLFITMAKAVLNENGVVYGCKLGKNLDVYHSRATTLKEITEFQGSKYVKSDLKNVYNEVKEDLKNNKKVLFSGTGCQIAGLNAVLNESDTTNLYTCDLICFGVPSPLIYKEYIRFIEEKENDKLISINFRDKSLGWSGHQETLKFESKKMTVNYYASIFYSTHTLRPSCFNCKFANMDRVSDITIGDFWGIDKEDREFYDEKGVSLALINTEKGKKLIEKIGKDIHFIIVNSENYKQPRLMKPSTKPIDRDNFWKEYEDNGFGYIMKKYAKYGGKE